MQNNFYIRNLRLIERKKWIITVCYTIIAVPVYIFYDNNFWGFYYWIIYAGMFASLILLVKGISNTFDQILILKEDIQIYLNNNQDVDEIMKRFETIFSPPINLVIGVVFGIVMILEFYFLGFSPPGVLYCVYAFPLTFAFMALTGQGFYQVITFIPIVKYLSDIENVNYDIYQAHTTEALKKMAILHSYLVKNCIYTVSLIFLVFITTCHQRELFEKGISTILSLTEFKDYVFLFSWTPFVLFILLTIPVLVISPKRNITLRIKKLKDKSKESFKIILDEVRNDSKVTPYENLQSIYFYHTICREIDNTRNFPIERAYATSIFTNIITIIALITGIIENLVSN